MDEKIEFCKGGGCTAKLGPGALESVLKQIPKHIDPNLLVGFDSADDAAVYKLSDELAIVQTLDFFPPMVDDPYLFGQIAAANALSDIYAMGADVKMALNIVCFPEKMDLNILGQILIGGNEKVTEAGGVLAGGHSISDVDVKYGLSVTGTIHPEKVLANNGCKEGDKLILTKPLGVGIVATAARVGGAPAEVLKKATDSMKTLNKYAAEIIRKYKVHGCTDITGFGLLGHLSEMLDGKFTAILDQKEVPYIPECDAYVEEFYLTAAAQRNRNHIGGEVEFTDCSFAMEEILFDPQTSGGLLVSMEAKDAEKAIIEIRNLGLPCGIIGEIVEKKEKKIYVS
ncbi:MAG: selenide, water dikinase SelD [Clostridiaceae bacterium]